MKKIRKSVQAAAREGSNPVVPEPEHRLTWREHEFVNEYIKNKGNATRAAMKAEIGKTYKSSAELASRLLEKVEIQRAIEHKRAELRELLNVGLVDVIEVLIGQAFTKPSQAHDVIYDPRDREAFAGLDAREYGLYVRHSTGPEGGTEIGTLSAGERRAALNDIVDYLGLRKVQNPGTGQDAVEEFLRTATELLGRREEKT